MENFLQYLKNNWLEVSGVLTGIICVWYNTQQNVWGWFWGIISVTIYIFIFWEAKLYADMGLQVVFALLSIYGLFQWLYGGKEHTPLRVSQLPRYLIGWLVGIGLGGTALVSWLLNRYTDASLPIVDSFTTAVSLIAQWMLGRKYLENWYLWFFVDVIYVGIYSYKMLFGTSFLYAVYLVLCIKGYRDWKQEPFQNP
ncbi:MAG: nicotinamide riboside transporter PnuC [Siphonobacter sp.]